MLSPTLFTIYMLPLGHVISRHGIQFHCCADDTQQYIKVTPSLTPSATLTHLTSGLEEIEVAIAKTSCS